ncbi:MAG: Panacea domain-containing protein [Acidimicrobiia bacterium]
MGQTRSGTLTHDFGPLRDGRSPQQLFLYYPLTWAAGGGVSEGQCPAFLSHPAHSLDTKREEGMSSWETHEEDKTAELVLLVAKHTEDDPTAGSTKLNKILYFAEVSHLRRTGQPITGSEYQKQPHGPTLRRMPPVVRQLENEGAAKEVEEDYFGYAQKKLVALRDPDLSGFSAIEIESVMDMIRQFWGKSAKEVSDISHEDPGWRAVDIGETIPLELAFVTQPEVTEAIRERARQLASDHA